MLCAHRNLPLKYIISYWIFNIIKYFRSCLALVVELQALVKTTNARGERCHTLLREITPEANSKFICNSKIFAVVSGEENGMRN